MTPGEVSKIEADNMKNLYADIKTERDMIKKEKVVHIRDYNDKVARGQQPRLKNSSPYYINQQAKRFGLESNNLKYEDLGSRKITSFKQRKILNRDDTASEIMEKQFINYRDNQRIDGHVLSHKYQADRMEDL